jgi:hypothetical protein
MFAMSAKLVPVWSVTIEPRLIGVPDAAWPGLVPHCDVLTVDALAELVAVDVLAGALELLLELELELLLQPAAAIATAAASTIVLRADSIPLAFGTGICALISPPFRW